MDLLRHFQTTIRRMDALRSGHTVVIGVSGGADSLALLHLFAQSQPALGVTPYAVHVHHGIRGDEADQDAAFVARIAEAWSIPHRIERVDVPGIAREYKLSVEEAARKARYTALARVAGEIGAAMIAVAHNADDQAETVIMHLLRGSGLAGLRGMLPVSVLSEKHLLPGVGAHRDAPSHGVHARIIRPLLDVPRAEIETYCAAQGLEPRIDSTNEDTSYTRNRIRHEVMPALKAVSANVVETLSRTAKILAADYEWFQDEVVEALPYLTRTASARGIEFDRADWRGLPLAMQRNAIRMAVQSLHGSLEDLTLEHVEQAVEIARDGDIGSKAQLPGRLMLHVTGDTLVITEADDLREVVKRPDMPLLLAPHLLQRIGEFDLPQSGWRFELEEYTGERTGRAWSGLIRRRWAAPFAADNLTLPLTLQPRRPELTFYPQGAGGSQSLKKFMNQAKIPAIWRDQIPILTHGDDVIWVCGYRVDDRFIVRPETQRVWLARFEKAR
jgi:tRNA(Ile)-lysidine synthetase-like protein